METTLWVITVALAAGCAGYAIGKGAAGRNSGANAGHRPGDSDGQLEAMLENQREISRSELLQTVGRLRHDWMNDIQVLSGYIQLRKYEYLQPFVEKIKAKMQNESALAKLGVPSLIAYILTFRTECKEFELEVELPEDIVLTKLPIDAKQAEALIRYVASGFRRHALDYIDEPNVLSIELADEDEGLLLDFVYRGQYDREALRPELEHELSAALPGIEIEACEIEPGHAALAVRLPYGERISEA